MPDFILKLYNLFNQAPFWCTLAVVVSVWGWLNWKVLNASGTHPGSFINAITSFETNSLGERYRRLLAYLLDKSSVFFKDQATFSQASSASVPAPQQAWLTRLFGFNPFTAASYVRCLQFAVIYPLLFFAIGWACGGEGKLNGVVALTGVDIAGVAIFAFGAVFLLVTDVAVVTVAVFAAVGVVFIGMLSFTGAGIFASIMSFMGLRKLYVKRYYKAGWFWVFFTVQLLLLTVWMSDPAGSMHNSFLAMFFCCLLPLVNAPLDWLSLGVTRGLLQSVRTGHHGGKLAVAWGLLDLFLALIFLFIISAVMVLMISFAGVVTGAPLMDLPALFAALRNNPTDASHWWVYFMLLSTLVPTLFHFALAGGATTLWLPQHLRQQWVSDLEIDYFKILTVCFFITVTPFIGFILAPLALCYLLYSLLAAHGAVLGNVLLNWVEMLAALFGG